MRACVVQKYERDYDDVDGFILLYSVTDRRSYTYVVSMLSNIRRNDKYSSTAVILVANKTDLVRKRQVADRGTSYIRCPKNNYSPFPLTN